MKILLLGKNGQVGWELNRTLLPLGEIIALGRKELNLTNKNAVRKAVRSINPDLIVNAAAYTAVDKAEEEADLAYAINGIAPGILAEEASICNAALVHYSTDYVFNGKKESPYTEKDQPDPINTYGKTKLVGENAIIESEVDHLILRTSWVYGLRGKNFLLTILRLAKEQNELKIIDDQIGSPTWSRLIAEATAMIIAQKPFLSKEKQGVYHLSSAGKTSWHGFANAIIEMFLVESNSKPVITAISTEDYKTLAARPKNSLLDNSRLISNYNIFLPHWQQYLDLLHIDYIDSSNFHHLNKKKG